MQFPEALEEEVTDTADDTGEGVPELGGLTLQEPPVPLQEAGPQDPREVGVAEPMEWQDELESGMKPVVTPLLSGEAVRTLLAGSKMSVDYAWEAQRLRLGIRIVFPEEAKKMEQIPISDRQVVESVRAAHVVFASGESDGESICDQFPRSGCMKWRRRKPYCFRLDSCPLESRNYRRLMKCRLTPGVSLRADIFGPPEGVMGSGI